MRRLLLALAFCLFGASAYAQNGVDLGIPVHGAVQNRSTVNSSATIVTGGTFQTVVVAQSVAASSAGTTTQRQALSIENNNTNGDNCYIFLGSGTATAAKSILLIKGGSYTRYWPYVPSDAIQATCDTTSDTLYVDTQ